MSNELKQAHLDWWENLPALWKRIFVHILYHAKPCDVSHYWWNISQPDDLKENYIIKYQDLTQEETLHSPNDLLRLFQVQSICYRTEVYLPAYFCVKNIPPLHYFEDLRLLDLSENCVNDLSGLKGLKKLIILSLHDNYSVKDLSPLAELTSLQELDLSCNQIRDISPLKNLINLKKLDLWDNDILSISELRSMHQLQELSLFNNPIVDIRSLSCLQQLKDLDLGNEDFYFDDTHIAWLKEQLPDCKIEVTEMLRENTDEYFLRRVIWGKYYCRDNEDVLARFEQIKARNDLNLDDLLVKAQNAYALQKLREEIQQREYGKLPALQNINRALFPTWTDELLYQLTLLANEKQNNDEKENLVAKIQKINPENLNLFFEILRDMDLLVEARKWR